MKFLSLCSGIEAASQAFLPLGWECVAVAEIEPFPCAVLKHHYPHVPNYGDITRFRDWPLHAIDLLIGGTPCQSFSVAGLRKGLADPRGNLALTFLAVVERYAPTWVVWENVPGVFSSWSDVAAHPASEASRRVVEEARRLGIAAGLDLGADFGADQFEEADQSNDLDCFLAGLRELGYGFALASLDAQYRGLAQRRERVFVVGHSGGQWQRAAAVLFDRESLSGNPPPSRQARQGVAPTIAARTRGGGGLGTDFDCDGGLDESAIPIQEIGKRQSGTPMNGVGHGQPGDPMFTLQSTAVHGVCAVSPTLRAGSNQTGGDRPPGTDVDTADSLIPVVTHSFTAEGFDASEDGSGRGVPMVADCLQERDSKGKNGHLIPVSSPIAFQPRIARNGRGDMGDKVNALQAQSGETGKGDAAPCVAFQPRYFTRDNKTGGKESCTDQTAALSADHGGGDSAPHVATGYQVRRLTPEECEKLQGFPTGYTAIPGHKADGPRYKALGNSMAVPVIRWIGERISSICKQV